MKRKNNKRTTREDKTNDHFRPAKPLQPLNQIQSEFIHCLKNSPITIATGHPGTSKTYIPTRLASLWLKQGAINRIILLRPAVSASQSIGFAKGTHEEKMKHWLRPILSTLQEEFSHGQLTYMMKEEIQTLDFCPLENVKGNSWHNAFIIVDEAEDCTVEEIRHLISRVGQNCTMAICGDINQTDLATSGLGLFTRVMGESTHLSKVIEHVDFNEYDDIVRSEVCKNVVMGWDEIAHLLNT